MGTCKFCSLATSHMYTKLVRIQLFSESLGLSRCTEPQSSIHLTLFSPEFRVAEQAILPPRKPDLTRQPREATHTGLQTVLANRGCMQLGRPSPKSFHTITLSGRKKLLPREIWIFVRGAAHTEVSPVHVVRRRDLPSLSLSLLF